MNALHEQFVAEARELIQQATDDLIALEREGFQNERVDRVFRSFHTLKGSAGMVQLPAMNMALHAGEDVLAAIRNEQLDLSLIVIDRLLACLDLVSQWVEAFSADGAEPAEAGQTAAGMKEQLRGLLSGDAAPPSSGSLESAAGGVDSRNAMPPWVLHLIKAGRERLGSMRGKELVAVSYEPRPDCFFDGDDPLQTMRKLPDMVVLHVDAVKPWPPLSEFDPYRSNLRFQCITAASRPEVAKLFRLVPDQVRFIDIPASVADPRSDASNDALDLVRAILEEQLRVLRQDGGKEDFAGRSGSAARVAGNALRHGLREACVEDIEHALADAMAKTDATPLTAALEATLASFLPVSAEAQTPKDAQAPDADRRARQSLRVDEAKIDTLGNLAGEFIVLKNALAHLAKQGGTGLSSHDMARAVRREADSMERLAAELHSAILQLRMVPVGQAFRPFSRLVRDMAQHLGKKVALTIEGATTEADKRIVDRLHEPLIHLVRNAIDHGIESPEERHRAGKTQLARLVLSAAPGGRRFMVEVTDDGRGIDPRVLRRKAEERGLFSAEELAAMPDEQVTNLIFASGFSTAAQVSDISGRGVGMNAVRAAVEQLEGRVSLISAAGSGTTIRLDLPADIAMTRVMVVEAGGQVFGIPMDAVTETIRLTQDRISQIKNNEGFTLRDRVAPIRALAEHMNLPSRRRTDGEARLLLITEAGGRIAAIEVDAILDRLEVVLKPMQGLLSGARGYSGTTLLGDGRVLLVLDVKEVLP